MASLRARLGRLTVRAPMSGVIETVVGAPGDLVAAGANLGRIGALTQPRVRLGVDPALASALHPGVVVHLARLQGGGEVEGRIVSIDPRADGQTRLASVIVAPALAPRLAPGEAVRGDIVRRQFTGQVVPRAAVYYEQDQPYLLVVANGVATKREVRLGVGLGGAAGRVQVAEGLRPGERIVIEGGASLDDGTKVEEASPAPAREDKGA